jgi:hypothetical protein
VAQHSGPSLSHKDGERSISFSELVANCQTTRRRMPEYHSVHIYRHEMLKISVCSASCVRLCEVRFQWRVVACTVLNLPKPEENTYLEETNRHSIQLLRFVDYCVRSDVLFTRVKTSAMHRVIFHFPFFQYEHPILILSVTLFVLCPFISIRCWFLLYLLMLPEDTFWNNRIQMSLFEEVVFCLLSGGRLCSFHSRRPLITTLTLE